MAPRHSGYRAQGQLNADLIIGKFSINITMLCDDFAIVHRPIDSSVSKNVTQVRSNSSCPILKTIPHAILTSSSQKLLFYCDQFFANWTSGGCIWCFTNIFLEAKHFGGKSLVITNKLSPVRCFALVLIEMHPFQLR